jgi:hypothetical protein
MKRRVNLDNSSSDGKQRREGGSLGKVEKIFAFIGYLIFSVVLAGALVELGAFAIWTMKHGLRPNAAEKLGSESPAYAQYSWAGDFWKEERARRKFEHGSYVPFRIWGVAPWHGKYINTDTTEMGTWRRTVNPMGQNCSNQPSAQVWMFGGSTLYGTGVPDFATIPSYLSEQLNARGQACWEVTNFGAEGYNTNQELILLVELLKAGRRPAEVIFYDGFNDSYVGAFAPAKAGTHWYYDTIKARVEGSLAGKLEFLRHSYALGLAREAIASHRRSELGTSETARLSEKVTATLDNYEENLRMAQKLGQSYGFVVRAFWQPALAYGKKPISPYEQQLIGFDRNAPEGSAFPAVLAVYEEAQRRAGSTIDIAFLGNIFDCEKEPIYLDRWMHLAPKGNELVAQKIFEGLMLLQAPAADCRETSRAAQTP